MLTGARRPHPPLDPGAAPRGRAAPPASSGATCRCRSPRSRSTSACCARRAWCASAARAPGASTRVEPARPGRAADAGSRASGTSRSRPSDSAAETTYERKRPMTTIARSRPWSAAIDLRCSADHAFTVFTDRIADVVAARPALLGAGMDGHDAVDCVLEPPRRGPRLRGARRRPRARLGTRRGVGAGRAAGLDWNPSLETRPYTRVEVRFTPTGDRRLPRRASRTAGSRSCGAAGRDARVATTPAGRSTLSWFQRAAEP